MIEITFLGTSSMIPTKERNHTSVLLTYKSHGILFDCGEGTQRQLKLAGIRPTKVTKMLISHWHGDHVLGIPGLIQTLGACEYNQTLEIYGPRGTKKYMDYIFKGFVSDKKIEIKIVEIESGMFFQNSDFELRCLPLDHGVPTLGYAFIETDKRRIDVKKVKKLGIPEGMLLGKLAENKTIIFNNKKITPEETTYIQKGKKVVFITDTMACTNAHKLAEDADLLICEATYASDLEGKSETYGHMTAKQAALIASQANAKKLYMIHFSARYKSLNVLEEDARNVFNESFAAKDLMHIKI